MEDNKKMENQEVETKQEILVDGKAVEEQPKKVGFFQKLWTGAKKVGNFVWDNKKFVIGAVAGAGSVIAIEAFKGMHTIQNAYNENSSEEETYDDGPDMTEELNDTEE